MRGDLRDMLGTKGWTIVWSPEPGGPHLVTKRRSDPRSRAQWQMWEWIWQVWVQQELEWAGWPKKEREEEKGGGRRG